MTTLQLIENQLPNFNHTKYTSVKSWEGSHSRINYHNGTRKNYNPSYSFSEFSIGIEAEKEDKSNCYNATDILTSTSWVLESDGSLNSFEGGFELVSPQLYFDIKKPIYEQEQWINTFIEPVKVLLNGNYSSRCGGHIHLSKHNTTNYNLARDLKYLLPIFTALYFNRAYNENYSKAIEFDNLRQQRGAFNLSSYNTVEFRIFPAIENVEVLLDRLELIRLVLNHCNEFDSYLSVYEAVLNPDHILYKHINNMFSHNVIVKSFDEFKINLLKTITMWG